MAEGLRALVDIEVPVVLAPMGGTVGPELCAAVSNAGGLGMIAVWWADPDGVADRVQAVHGLTSKPFGVNFNNNFPQDDQLTAAIDAGASIASFFWGFDADRIARAKDAGLTVMQTVGRAADAVRAVDDGADIVVAQGWEAGGHVWGQVATVALVPSVVDAVAPTPVVAAGGIVDGRGLAAVLALGASAAWMGTRFLAADEARIDDDGRARIFAASDSDTVMGKDANPHWLDAPVRHIGTRADPWTAESLPGGTQLAGQGVGLVTRQQPAADIVAEVWSDARETLRSLQHLT
jgi:NAD(P)H-dependent flavin oxidoreductase YrpB (nitropropane dioxygenase family)